MIQRPHLIFFVTTFCLLTNACSSTKLRDLCGSSFKENKVSVRSGNSDRIDFDLCGDPFPSSVLTTEEQKLNYQGQLRIIMRAYADKRLAELNLCPHGFIGPNSVNGPRYDFSKRVFFVDCSKRAD